MHPGSLGVAVLLAEMAVDLHRKRAAGRANGSNMMSIVIPCHRVIAADGTLSGYGGGVWRKQRLLEHEGLRRAQT